MVNYNFDDFVVFFIRKIGRGLLLLRDVVKGLVIKEKIKFFWEVVEFMLILG